MGNVNATDGAVKVNVVDENAEKIDESKFRPIECEIARFDAGALLQKEPKSIQMKSEILTFYRTAPDNAILEINEDIKPVTITQQGIRFLSSRDYGTIPINYSTLPQHLVGKKLHAKPCPLNNKCPPRSCWNLGRIGSFCSEIVKVERSLNSMEEEKNNPLVFNFQSQDIRNMENEHKMSITDERPVGARFVTYRGNLRSLGNVAL